MIKQNNRKYYEKPRINEVKLEIEEAVLAGCKMTTAGASGKNQVRTPCKIGTGGGDCKSVVGS